MFDVNAIRKDFPILSETVYDKRLAYLDNAASAQRPSVVIDAISQYYQTSHSNVHRGVHALGERATQCFEQGRKKVAEWINASSTQEVIFTKGTTESINLVAASYADHFLKAGDEVIISTLEHHANIVPWQQSCQKTGAHLKIIPITDDGELQLDAYEALLSDKTKIVAIGHVSNALGIVNPVQEIIRLARAKTDAVILVDGAQAMPHGPIDVQALDCDFYAFSGHKMFAPTGIGVLYGKKKLLDQMPPYQTGGEMIAMVTFEKTTFNELPHKFEAGTPNIAGVHGLRVAIDYLQQLDWAAVNAYEQSLLAKASERLRAESGVKIIGDVDNKASVISFVMDDAHPHDIATIFDREGVAVRAGHHCAMPLMQRLALPATTRASFSFYNTEEDIDQLVSAIHTVKSIFQ